jgi:uncharacterized protein YcnI
MSTTTRRRALRVGTVLGVATTIALATAAPAFAHVTAQPGTAEQGSYSVVAFRVPNESDTAGTIKLELNLPADHPINSVRTTPIPGWTATTTKAPLNPPVTTDHGTLTEAVSTVTWTADPGMRIEPGQYVDFPLSLGPLPTDTDRLVIPAVQTYDDGEVVRWDQPPSTDGSEPEQPAPVITLTPATDEQPGHMAAPAAGAPAAGAPTSGTDTTARWLGGAGLLIGALGLGVGIGALLGSRRRAGGTQS